MVLGIQAHVPNRIVEIPVVIEVGMGDRGPPSQTVCGSRLFGTVDQFALLVFPKLDRAPFRGQNKIGPPVPIKIAPEGRSDHARILEARSKGTGNIRKFTTLVQKKGTDRGLRVFPSRYSSTHE